MSRTRIAAYVPPDLAEAIKRLAAIEGVSVSDLVEDAVAKFLHTTRGEAEHAALMAKLETMQRRLIAVERSQETLFELTAHAARFSMSMAPDVPDAERTRINARGAERFANVIDAIVKRLGAGKSVWKDHFPLFAESKNHAAPKSAASVEAQG